MAQTHKIENFEPTEALITTPNGVALLLNALREYEDNNAEVWELSLINTLMNNLKRLRQPEYDD